jgi:hypothetical protein
MFRHTRVIVRLSLEPVYVSDNSVAYPGIFFGGGFRQEFFSGGIQQIQLRTEGRESGDLGAAGP